jgi:ketosteroid isomerase-like protein
MMRGPNSGLSSQQGGFSAIAGSSYNNLYHFPFEMRDGKIQAVRESLDTMHAKEGLVDP